MTTGVCCGSQRGIALAVVLWFVAGMSLLVAAVVGAARTDLRLAQVHLHRAQATAAADGAANLFLADLVDSRLSGDPSPARLQGSYTVGSLQVSLTAVPAAWLVDVNSAPAELVAEALGFAPGIDRAKAQELAVAVVQWRSSNHTMGRTPRFSAVEDLLNVPGINRSILDSVRDYLAEPGSRGLAGTGRSARERLELAASMAPGAPSPGVGNMDDAGLLRRAGAEGAVDGTLRVDAVVNLGERRWLRRRWIRSAVPGNALPWSAMRTEPVRVVGD